MKYIWELGDIIPGRTLLRQKGGNLNKMKSFILAQTPDSGIYILVVLGEDGRSYKPCTKEEMVDKLTEGDYIPTETLPPQTDHEDDIGYDRFRDLKTALKTLVRLER